MEDDVFIGDCPLGGGRNRHDHCHHIRHIRPFHRICCDIRYFVYLLLYH